MTTDPDAALRYLENRYDGHIPDGLREQVKRGEFNIPTSGPLPTRIGISVEVRPAHWPADTDALRIELRRAVGFVANVQPVGIVWAMLGRRQIKFECEVDMLDDPNRLRGALARVVRVQCGASSTVEFGGALAL